MESTSAPHPCTNSATARSHPSETVPPAAGVIIRTKNEGRHLGWCLRELHRQQFTDFEVIVVDSGSTDNTLEIARQYSVRILTIPRESFTYGYALNVGIAATRASIVVSLSGHSIPASDLWLGNLLHPFGDARVAGAFSRQRCHRPCPIYERLFVFCVAGHPIRVPWLSDQLFTNAASAIRRDLWERIPFDESLPACEDIAWRLQAQDHGYPVRYAPDSIGIHSHAETFSRFLRRRLNECRGLVRLYVARRRATSVARPAMSCCRDWLLACLAHWYVQR